MGRRQGDDRGVAARRSCGRPRRAPAPRRCQRCPIPCATAYTPGVRRGEHPCAAGGRGGERAKPAPRMMRSEALMRPVRAVAVLAFVLGAHAARVGAAVVVRGAEPEPLRARRARRAVSLVPGDAGREPDAVRLSRGLPRRGPLSPARHLVQLHHVPRRQRRVLLREPVHRRRAVDRRVGQRGAGPPGLRRQPGVGGRPGAWRPAPRHRRRRRRDADCHRRHRQRVRRRRRGRRGRRRLRQSRRRRPLGGAAQAAGDHPDGVADPRRRRRWPQGRLPVLPQLRPAQRRRARRGVRVAGRGRGERAGARPALQRRRAGRRRGAPGQPHRRHRHRRAGLRRVPAQRSQPPARRDAALRRAGAGAAAWPASSSSPRRRRRRPASW